MAVLSTLLWTCNITFVCPRCHEQQHFSFVTHLSVEKVQSISTLTLSPVTLTLLTKENVFKLGSIVIYQKLCSTDLCLMYKRNQGSFDMYSSSLLSSLLACRQVFFYLILKSHHFLCGNKVSYR